MNILVVGKFYTEGFAEHISETLSEMGHSILHYQPGLSYSTSTNSIIRTTNKIKSTLFELYSKTPIYHNNNAQHLKNLILDKKIDLTIVCHDFLNASQVSSIREHTKSPVVLWFPDAISNFRNAMFLNAPYDFLFFKEPFAVKIISNELGKKSYYLPECCNPKYHRPVNITKKDEEMYGCELTTAGNLHTARVAFFDQLSNYNVKIWGLPAPHWVNTQGISKMIQNRFVSNEEKSKSFLCSKIVINSLHPTEIFGTNVRTFEVAGTGSFQMVSWRPGLSQLFDDGKELIGFRGIRDLKEKIDYYLSNDKERLRIAHNGYIRAHAEHTYQKRLELLINTIFNGYTGFSIEENYCI